MAQVVLTSPFAEIHGSIGKDKIINRQKKYRDERGRVLHEGKQEAYVVRHPRDQKKNPRQGVELATSIAGRKPVGEPRRFFWWRNWRTLLPNSRRRSWPQSVSCAG